MEGLKLYFSRSIFCLRRDVQSQDRNEKGISQIPRRMYNAITVLTDRGYIMLFVRLPV